MIPFNKPYLHGRELVYIAQAVASGKISGDGLFSRRCQEFFRSRYKYGRTLLTTSCTDALEMSALLLDIRPGDEVILPSFTFVSTANAFALRGAKLVFADSQSINPNIDPGQLEALISPATRAIVIVHYAGIACDMDAIMDISRRHGLPIVEDAAHAIDSFHDGRPLGGFGAMATFSFHETKNLTSGEGGMLVVNDAALEARAEVIREKGTNRSAFFRGEIAKYAWIDLGSSFLPSEIVSAYLYAQLEVLDDIQKKRLALWNRYRDNLSAALPGHGVQLPVIPRFATNNAHMFYLVCASAQERSGLLEHLSNHEIMATFHYQSLHKSPFFIARHDGRLLPNSDRYSDRLLRLPLFYELEIELVDAISEAVAGFYSASGHRRRGSTREERMAAAVPVTRSA
ncbi:MAG: dTDP-4-amino-4,6-dideoxygalactose transaminase [Steroidobacteraceae bacterium]